MLSKISFIGINIFSSAILFIRSIFFLRYLPDDSLGIIMLFQALIALFSVFQFGIINGGLRFFSIDNYVKDFTSTNNFIHSFILGLTLISILILFATNLILSVDIKTYSFAIITGGFALLNNWVINLLIARKQLKSVNMLNLMAAIISALTSLLIFPLGNTGALIAIASSYITSPIIFFILFRQYRVSKVSFDFAILKKLLYFGFVPYLSGITITLNNSIDKFFIAHNLSYDGLGKFYLATIFLTVFNLFPNNLNSVLYPGVINNYTNRKLNLVIRTIRNYMAIILIYNVIMYASVHFFGEKLVFLIFPDKIDQLKYLLIILPGILAISFSKPLSFLLYTSLNQKSIFLSNLLSLSLYLIFLVILGYTSHFNLINISYGKSGQGIFVFIFILISLIISWKKIKTYYYLDKNTYL